MIARVAGHCCWLYRYVERLENTVRLLSVMNFHELDVGEAQGGWAAVLVCADERARFLAEYNEDAERDGEAVQQFLTWDEHNPVSLLNSLRFARENARSIRETISIEMWEALNGLWIWMVEGPGRKVYARDRQAFYGRVRTSCQVFHGFYHTTMLYEEPFDMMRLGSLLERAGQTTRVVNAFCFAAGAQRKDVDAAALALTTLRTCSALEAFLKRTTGPMSASAVATFLLEEPAFPRSVRHCLERGRYFLLRGRPPEAAASVRRSTDLLDVLLESLGQLDLEGDVQGVRTRLRRLLSALDDFGDAITAEIFEPVLPQLARGRT